MTENLLQWSKKDLTKQRDKTTGSTPLHMAATWEEGDKTVIKLLLKTDKSSAFLSDNNGSFPIHAAAARMYFPVARLILNECPGCAGLQDGQGKTFLHIAVEKERPLVVGFVCWQRRFEPILNIRDNDGNTALHLAAEVGNHCSFYSIIQNPHVQLDLVNNEGKTPMDTAEKLKPEGIVFSLNPRLRIYLLLKGAGAKNGIFRWDWLSEDHAGKKDVFYEDYERRISESSQVIGIGSVLIITVAFAAAFTLPGAFIGADHYGAKGPCTLHGGQQYCAGKATLAYNNSFRAFIIANTMALVCSALATMAVMFAAVATVDIRTRMFGFLVSVFFLYCSAKSLAVAFLCGLFAMLPKDAFMVAYISCVIGAPFLILDVLWCISMFALGEIMLLMRLGWTTWFRSSHLQRTCIADLFRVLVMPLPRRKSGHPLKNTRVDDALAVSRFSSKEAGEATCGV